MTSARARFAPLDSPPEAVLFDYHQTLFQVDDDRIWVRAAARHIGMPLTDVETVEITRRMAAARGWPEVLAGQQGRDRSAPAHRRATAHWLRVAGVPEPLIDALYHRMRQPAAWHPYPDTAAVLRGLSERGVPVGVVSNTGWDLRKTFRHHGLFDYVRAFVLSWEWGLEKPDARLFRLACAQLGADPAATVMVGDNPYADGGAVAAGLRAYLLPTAPPRASRGLGAVLRLVELS